MTPWPELDVTHIHTMFDVAAPAIEELQHEDEGEGPTVYLATAMAKPKAKAMTTVHAKATAKMVANALAGPPPPPTASATQEVCPHTSVRTGSNQHVSYVTCKTCNLRLETGPPKASAKKSAAEAAMSVDCLHTNVRSGSNQYISYKTCKDCNTRLETTPTVTKAMSAAGSTEVPPPTKASRTLPSAAAAPEDCLHTSVRTGANQYSSYVTCKLCNVRLSTTPKAKSFVGTAEALTNVREDNEETEETKAQHQGVVMDLITKITKDTSLVMTAEIEEMVETLRAKVGIGIWDTGCRKTVAGATWIKT